MEALSYNVYRKHLKRHLDCAALKELGVFPTDYSTHSFRKGSLSMLADGDMHPAYIQKAARHKRGDSSVTYIESSLSKALKANEILSGNNSFEGWGSRYSGNPRSLSCFLPEKFITKLPAQADNSLERGVSMNSITSIITSGSLLLEDSTERDINTPDQVKVCDKKTQSMEALVVTDMTAAASPSRPTLNLAALEALQVNGALQVTFPRSLQRKKVTFSTPPPLE